MIHGHFTSYIERLWWTFGNLIGWINVSQILTQVIGEENNSEPDEMVCKELINKYSMMTKDPTQDFLQVILQAVNYNYKPAKTGPFGPIFKVLSANGM